MHIIFGNVTLWQVFIMKLLRYFRFEVFYLYIDTKSDRKKNEIAIKLKKNNIFPLPLEFQKKISPKASYSLRINDPDEIAYKRNIKLAPDTILKKYCNLFSINEKKIKKAVDLSVEKYCGVMEMFRRFAEIKTNIHIHNK